MPSLIAKMLERTLAMMDALLEGLILLFVGLVLLVRWRSFARSREQAHELLYGDVPGAEPVYEGLDTSRKALVVTVAGLCLVLGALSVARYFVS